MKSPKVSKYPHFLKKEKVLMGDKKKNIYFQVHSEQDSRNNNNRKCGIILLTCQALFSVLQHLLNIP